MATSGDGSWDTWRASLVALQCRMAAHARILTLPSMERSLRCRVDHTPVRSTTAGVTIFQRSEDASAMNSVDRLSAALAAASASPQAALSPALAILVAIISSASSLTLQAAPPAVFRFRVP